MQIFQEETVDISTIVKALQAGKTIVYPTETCYGLGCDATNADAVAKIFAIKKRQANKSMLVVMPDVATAKEHVVWNEELQAIADQYWPGPVTAVAYADTSNMAPVLVRDDGTIAFRITSHPIAQQIASKLGAPLVSTSANIASMESPYDIEQVQAMFDGQTHQPDIIIDGGTLPERAPSTIVSTVGGALTVLRQGEVIINITP